MAPPRPRAGVEDARPEASISRDRAAPASVAAAAATKQRRTGPLTATTTSSLRDVAAMDDATAASSTMPAPGTAEGSNGISWSTLDTQVLHSYRHAYGLSSPSAFHSSLNQMILTKPGLGRHSPTMARRVERRRVTKEQLALSVRKNFNGLGIQEGEVVVDFLYKVRWQDKSFRLRFAPSKTGR